MSESKLFASVSPKTGFFLGLGAALVVFFAVGFFVLLGMVLKDDEPKISAGENSGPPAVAGDTVTGEEVQKPVEIVPVSATDWARGPEDAAVTIVEFSDYDCPYCASFQETMNQLTDKFPRDVRWIYRHFPLASLHPNASRKAEGAECAGKLEGNEGFWKFSDLLFEKQGTAGATDDLLISLASQIGIPEKDFTDCLENGEAWVAVGEDTDDAVAAGAQGTPYSVFLIGEDKIPVSGALPYEQISSIVVSSLEKQGL